MEILTEIEAGGDKYRILKMAGKDQLHVFRRIWPTIMPVVVAKIKGIKPNPVEVMMHMGEKLASMPDEEFEHIRVRCLGAAMRSQDGGVHFAQLTLNGREMFADIDGPAMLKVVRTVLDENIIKHAADFSAALLAPMSSEGQGQAST
jgi:hypothetical protein